MLVPIVGPSGNALSQSCKHCFHGVILNILMGRRSVAGSVIGGIAETQEMLDFCGKHGITSDIEVIKIQDINEAYERLLKSDVKYRFVIDMATLRPERETAGTLDETQGECFRK